jgi:primosomal protein N' (replication factor Y)
MAVRDRDRQVLILVPEIALTPAVAATFRHTFGDRVAIQHSALSDGERHDQWHRIRRGDVDVVVGTRSAVFAPLSRVGLIIVDEEHDTSYKQDDAPRYNGRDVAIVRARAARALVVLGSATPSLESYHNAMTGRYQIVELKRRVLDRRLAQVSVVNMREEYADAGPDVVLSQVLQAGLVECLGRGDQAMVLLNRRGYAPTVFCRQCAGRLECPNCSVSLTVHKAAHRARCHYCDYSVRVPDACDTCGGTYLEYTGVGTERVESELREMLPGIRVARVDRDTIRRRGEIARVLGRFARREIDVLVGTQMIAKGHDFPAVTLVGVISADVGLGLADFRAAERTFQLLTQVAGRAGRGAQAGTAIVQTLYPEHYSIRHACTQDYRAFYDEEIHYRRSMRYPPSCALINLTVRGSTTLEALSAATDLAGLLRKRSQHYLVLGPAPAPLQRLRGEHRVQIFLKGTARKPMRLAVREALEKRPDLVRRTTVDVDPISVL